MASTPFSNIALPTNVTDPLYTSSQSGLNTLGTNLISGNGAPGQYSDLGKPDSPAFQAMLNSVKGQIMQGSQESSAISGTGRSGVAQTASNNALNSVVPQLTYQDFLTSQSQQQNLLGAGIDIQQGVRGSAQGQQQFDSTFNQNLFQDQDLLAQQNNQFKQQAAAAQGQFYGNLGTALFGSDVGNLISGGMGGSSSGGSSNGIAGNSLSSLFSYLGSMGGSNGSSLSSTLGSFGSSGLSSYGGTSAIDSLLSSGAPLALAGV